MNGWIKIKASIRTESSMNTVIHLAEAVFVLLEVFDTHRATVDLNRIPESKTASLPHASAVDSLSPRSH